jgi:hypothetical protein
LNGVSVEAAHSLLNAFFQHIQHSVGGLEQGVVNYPGFGSFSIKKIEKEVAGEISVRTRVWFWRAAAPKQDKRAATEQMLKSASGS